MAERYSDRFLKDQPTSYDVLELDEIGSRDRPAPDAADAQELSRAHRPWHGNTGARFALALTFMLGALLGAYGWDRERNRQAALADLGTVDLVIWLNTTGLNGTSSTKAEVIYRNEGSYPLTIHDFVLGDGQAVRVDPPNAITVEPGADQTQTLNMVLQCETDSSGGGSGWVGTSGYGTEPVDARLDIETADGARQRTVLPVILGPDLASWLTWGCESVGLSGFETASVNPTRIDETPGEPVRVQLEIRGQDGDERVEIAAVSMRSAAYQVTFTRRAPNSSDSFQRSPVDLEFSVNDCQRALLAGEQEMTILINGRFEGGEPGELWVYPTTDFVAALARLAVRECPG